MSYRYLGVVVKRYLNNFIKKWYNKKIVSLTDFAIRQPLSQRIPIWFEVDSGRRIDLNSNITIEDTTGLYQFLRCRGQHIIARQLNMNSKFVLVPHLNAPVIFYEKDYRNWQL